MKTASITEAQSNLSALIESLRDGSPVLITDQGRPVARLESVPSGDAEVDDDRLARLIRQGVVRPGRVKGFPALLMTPPPKADHGVSIVDAVIEERREGR